MSKELTEDEIIEICTKKCIGDLRPDGKIQCYMTYGCPHGILDDPEGSNSDYDDHLRPKYRK